VAGLERDDDPAACGSVRLDVWLWAARFFKTRALAKQAVETGKIELNQQPANKPAKPVRTGDRMRIMRAGERYEIEVRGLSDQRGPASVAATLYVEDPASIERRAAEREQARAAHAGFRPPESRPDKKSRRKIKALKDGPADNLPPWFPR